MNVNKNPSKNLLWNLDGVFLQSVSKIFSSSLKEIENQSKTCKKFWLGIIRLVPLHSHKNGWLWTEQSEGKSQKIFESWEATAIPILSGIGKSSEINSIWHVNSLNYWINYVSIKQHLQWRVWSWLRMNASGRLNTCKSWGSRGVAIRSLATGKRVRNTYTTFL
jgi:hypothetical protein